MCKRRGRRRRTERKTRGAGLGCSVATEKKKGPFAGIKSLRQGREAFELSGEQSKVLQKGTQGFEAIPFRLSEPKRLGDRRLSEGDAAARIIRRVVF